MQFIMPVSFGVEPRSEGVMGRDFVKDILHVNSLFLLMNPELVLDGFFRGQAYLFCSFFSLLLRSINENFTFIIMLFRVPEK